MNEPKDQPLWWIDFVEDELPPKEREEKRALLKHSGTDRAIVRNLLKMREVMQGNDPVELPQSESYYQELHDKIMNQVEALSTPSANKSAVISLSSKK